MMGLGEHVEGLGADEGVAVFAQVFGIPRQRGGVARDIHNFLGAERNECHQRLVLHARTRRVNHGLVPIGVANVVAQQGFADIGGDDAHPLLQHVVAQIGAGIGGAALAHFNANHAITALNHRHGK